MHYKIFSPGTDDLSDAPLHQHGLADLCRDSGADWQRTEGLDGKPGTVCTWRQGNPQLDAPDGCPDNFSWTPIPKTPLWFGYNPDLPPGPVELSRKKQLPGIPIQLGDGRAWQIPIARGLPCSIGVDDEGEPVAEVDERYRKFSERTFQHATLIAEREEQVADIQKVFFGVRLTDDEMRELYAANTAKWAGLSTLEEMDRSLAITIIFDEAVDHAADALSLNYRMNRWIMCHLRLLEISPTVNHLRDICLAAMEAESIRESLKKNDLEQRISLLAGSDTLPGEES